MTELAPGTIGRPGPMLSPSPVPGSWQALVDLVVGSDPGLNRLRNALQSVITIGVALVAEGLFIHFTHALQIRTGGAHLPAAQAATIAAVNHEYLVVAMLLGSIIGMISSFGIMDPTAKGQLQSLLFLPIPMVAALVLGLSIGGYRVAALVALAAVLAVGTYLRRFGPRGFLSGLVLFMGYFLGFFLHGAFSLSDLGWLCSEIGVGLIVAGAVRFGLFYPRNDRALTRTRRSYLARARKVASLTLELFDTGAPTIKERRRLSRQEARLNETALLIDAQLAGPGALADGSSAQLLHERLYDSELALTNVSRFAGALAGVDEPWIPREHIRAALAGIVSGDLQAARRAGEAIFETLRIECARDRRDGRVSVIITRRFAGSIVNFVDAMDEWITIGTAAARPDDDTFHTSISLFGGWLPGSTGVSAIASVEPSLGHREHRTMAPYTRTAIQIGVAVGASIVFGDLLSGARFYWAVIAAFIAFMGANNSGEQIRKALYRVVGTVVGILVGSLIAHAVGHHTNWSIAIILVSLFFGFYLMRINYSFMTIGITVTVAQLYLQLNEFSNSLLLVRLEETALGAAITMITVALVFPLRTRRVLQVAMRAEVAAVAELVDHATEQLVGTTPVGDTSANLLRNDAREVDAAHQTMIATVQPLRRNLFGEVDELLGSALRMAAGARNYGRNLVADMAEADRLDDASRRDIGDASATLSSSLDVLISSFNGPRDGIYTRSSSLYDDVERRLEERAPRFGPTQLAIRDLKLIDSAMADLAELMGLRIADYDTATLSAQPSP